MQAKRVLESALYVDDLEAAEAFYRDVLGLTFHARVEGRHVFFRCGDGMVLLFNPGATAKPMEGISVPLHGGVPGQGHLCFAVSHEELDPWRKHLAASKVDIEQEMTWPNGAISIYFRDPAGNSLELATPDLWFGA
ncbi:MAG: hypothetical protein AMXMBFR84_14440 [Candidatus Hydrogenedentota bacterium]